MPAVAWLSAAMYLLVAGGIPLPLPATAGKDLSRPFPCMDSPCGCRNAQQCWTSCCCHTPAERLAWARAHGVDPPASLMAIADMPTAKPPPATCCVQKNRSNLIAGGIKTIRMTVQNSAGEATRVAATTPTSHESILVIRALDCNGVGVHWLAGCVVTPPAVVCAHAQPQCGGDAVPATAHLVSSPAYPPPVPPPRDSRA